MRDVFIQFPTISIWHRLPQLVVSKYLIGFPTCTILCKSVSLNLVFCHMKLSSYDRTVSGKDHVLGSLYDDVTTQVQ